MLSIEVNNAVILYSIFTPLTYQTLNNCHVFLLASMISKHNTKPVYAFKTDMHTLSLEHALHGLGSRPSYLPLTALTSTWFNCELYFVSTLFCWLL